MNVHGRPASFSFTQAAISVALLSACGGKTQSDQSDLPSARDASVFADAPAADACLDVQQGIGRAPPTDVLILFDVSTSMGCPFSDPTCEAPAEGTPSVLSRHLYAGKSLLGYLHASSSAGRNVGLLWFPPDVTNDCMTKTASTFAVPWVPLPQSIDEVINPISVKEVGGTPQLAPALHDAIGAAAMFMKENPDHVAAVVVMADQFAGGCGSLPDAVDVASEGFNGIPSVKTLVVGVGTQPQLDSVALAGSGGALHEIPVVTDLATAINPKLDPPIADLTCTFRLSSSDVGRADLASTSVVATLEQSGTVPIPRVDDAAHCGTANGWYYDVNPPAVPGTVILCPQSCSLFKLGAAASIHITAACSPR